MVNNGDRYGAAYHEAGLAVVAWSLGLLSGGGIAIGIDGNGASGRVDIGPSEHLPITDQIAVCVAGLEAQELFECPTSERAEISEYVKVRSLVAAYHQVAEHHLSEEQSLNLWNAGCRRARTLLLAHKSRVVRLAAYLILHGQINVSEFRELMKTTI